jgi:hypothetical protein
MSRTLDGVVRTDESHAEPRADAAFAGPRTPTTGSAKLKL